MGKNFDVGDQVYMETDNNGPIPHGVVTDIKNGLVWVWFDEDQPILIDPYLM